MICFFCKANTQDDFTTHFVDLKSCMIIIKNTPCLKCKQCGECFFETPIVEKLEVIVSKLEELSPEIGVYDYSKVADLCEEKTTLQQNIV